MRNMRVWFRPLLLLRNFDIWQSVSLGRLAVALSLCANSWKSWVPKAFIDNCYSKYIRYGKIIV